MVNISVCVVHLECNNTSLPASPRHGFAFQDLDCLENLPDVVENLSHAQKQQAAEIDKQHQILADKKVRLCGFLYSTCLMCLHNGFKEVTQIVLQN